MSLLKEMRTNIKAYNKHMTDEYLVELDILGLLNNTHPLERKGFAFRAKKFGWLEEIDYKLYNKNW